MNDDHAIIRQDRMGIELPTDETKLAQSLIELMNFPNTGQNIEIWNGNYHVANIERFMLYSDSNINTLCARIMMLWIIECLGNYERSDPGDWYCHTIRFDGIPPEFIEGHLPV